MIIAIYNEIILGAFIMIDWQCGKRYKSNKLHYRVGKSSLLWMRSVEEQVPKNTVVIVN